MTGDATRPQTDYSSGIDVRPYPYSWREGDDNGQHIQRGHHVRVPRQVRYY
jgi:hypothetical protein